MIAGGTGITPMFQVCILDAESLKFLSVPQFIMQIIKFDNVYGFLFWSQVTRAILENPSDNTNINLIYANVTFEDILLKVILFRWFIFLYTWANYIFVDMYCIICVFLGIYCDGYNPGTAKCSLQITSTSIYYVP